MESPWEFQRGESIQVPCAVTPMQKDQTHAPREWFERIYNVQHWTELPRGGHFPNWEEPGLDAQEMRTFLRQ